jgi:hypothetical protein
MIPRGGADEFLDDQSLNIDERGDVFGIFAGQMRHYTTWRVKLVCGDGLRWH